MSEEKEKKALKKEQKEKKKKEKKAKTAAGENDIMGSGVKEIGEEPIIVLCKSLEFFAE